MLRSPSYLLEHLHIDLRKSDSEILETVCGDLNKHGNEENSGLML